MWHDFTAVVISIFLSVSGALADGTAHARALVDNLLSPPTTPTVASAQPSISPSQQLLPNSDPFHATSSENTELAETVHAAEPPSREPVTVSERRPGKVLGASIEVQPPSISLPTPSFVTHEEFSVGLDTLAKNLQLKIAHTIPVFSFSGPAATTPINTATFAISQKIDQLANVALTNATVNGLSGITDADIPDSLTASNYLPLSGGTLTGDVSLSGTLTAGALSVAGISSSGALIGPYVTATSTTATSTFAGGITGPGSFTVQNSSGKVGIGTGNPTLALDVRGSGGIRAGGANNGELGNLSLVRRNSSLRFEGYNLGTISFQGTIDDYGNVYTGAAINARTDYNPQGTEWSSSSSAGSLNFETTPQGSGSPIPRVWITSSGLVGIGNWDDQPSVNFPSHQLDLSISLEATAKTSAFSTLNISNTATSTTNSINKTGLQISSTGSWTGTSAANIGLYVSSVTGGTNNYDAIFNGGGNVGIGTTTPAANLVVNGTTGQNLLQVATSTNQNIFTINQQGLAGVGTAAADLFDPFEVGGYSSVAPAAATFRSTLTISDTYANDAVAAGYGAGIRFRGMTNFGRTTLAGIWAETEGSGTNGSLFFTTRGAGGSLAPDMVITSGGNVGVATTSPWRTLSVTGTVSFDGLTGSTGAGSLCLDSNKQVVYNSASDNCLSSTRATKHAIDNLSLDGLTIIDALQPVSFVYNEGDGRVRYGFIAEDTAAVDAHLATYNASGTVSGIDDRSILAIIVGAVKELTSKVSETARLIIAALTADEVTVNNKLCVGDTCVTPEQFKAVFGDQSTPSAQATADAPPGENGTSTVAGDVVSTHEATSTVPTVASSSPVLLSSTTDPEPETAPAPETVAPDDTAPEPEAPSPELQPANNEEPYVLPATGTK